MKLLEVAIAAWLFGLVAYAAALHVVWRQAISRGDLPAVMFWSALACVVTTAVIFAPIMFRLSSPQTPTTLNAVAVAERPNPWWVFVLVGTLLGVAPLLLTLAFWSTNIGRALFSPESALFYCFFGAYGATFGGGFYLIYERRAI